MTKLLYIEASPRKNRSVSIEIAETFRDAYLDAHPSDEFKTINLWSYPLPELSGDMVNGIYANYHGLDLTYREAEAWEEIVRVVEQFKSADKYLFSVPMWNFGIPYKLKHYLDVIVQPGLTCSYSKQEGYRGLVAGKPAVVIYTRGGSFAGKPQAPDFQKPYMEQVLNFIGIKDIRSIIVEPTLGPALDVQKIKTDACLQAEEIAASF